MRIVSPLPQRARNGSCLKCGSSSSKRSYIDLEVFIDFEGGLFLCTVCVTEFGHELGFMTEDKHESVKQNNQKLLASNKELHTRIDTQNKFIDAQAEEWIIRGKEHDTEVANARNAAIQETESRYAR